MNRFIIIAACLVVSVGSCKKEQTKILITETFDNGPTDSLRLNQIQVIASHNSYHLYPDDSVYALLLRLDSLGFLPSQYAPTGIDYTHLPFEQQFDDYNVRGLEIDFYNDPVGGQFYYWKGRKLLGLDYESHIPELLQPGFKIVHIPDFDYRTNYYTFVASLKAVYNWSVAHPNHLPIFINIETKEEAVGDEPAASGLDLTHAIPFDASACDKIDEEIKSVFGENLDKVITPDDVRGTYATLEQAALANNWPQLAQARNKVVFIMQGPAESLYKAGHPSLQGRAMFVYSNPGTPEAAFVIYNSPGSQFNSIRNRVSQGYIVRTRADDGTTEARTGDYTQMNKAFDSWAQIVSTDYYKADARAGNTGWTDYHVQFPNGELVRIDSVSAPAQLNLGLIKE